MTYIITGIISWSLDLVLHLELELFLDLVPGSGPGPGCDQEMCPGSRFFMVLVWSRTWCWSSSLGEGSSRRHSGLPWQRQTSLCPLRTLNSKPSHIGGLTRGVSGM